MKCFKITAIVETEGLDEDDVRKKLDELNRGDGLYIEFGEAEIVEVKGDHSF
jgi:hypothetical protein